MIIDDVIKMQDEKARLEEHLERLKRNDKILNDSKKKYYACTMIKIETHFGPHCHIYGFDELQEQMIQLAIRWMEIRLEQINTTLAWVERQLGQYESQST